MSDHDLDADQQEYFTFKLGGHQYKMRYPTTDEMEESLKFKDIADKKVANDEATSWVAKFISSDESEAPDIKTALKSVNARTMRFFNKMIKEEFYGE